MGTAPPLAPYEVPTLEHSGSAPPSPPPPPPERTGTGRHAVVNEATADRALRIALTARAAIGRPPNATDPGDEGEGLWTPLYRLQRGLARVETTCGEILKRIDVEAATADRRGGWAARVGWKMVDVLAGALVVGALAYLAGFHR